MARLLSLVVAFAVPLVSVACAGSGPDQDAYVKANEAVFSQLPVFPGVTLREKVSAAGRAEEDGPVVGYTTRYEFVLPKGAQDDQVASFYLQRLDPKWRLVERLAGPGQVLNFRNGRAGLSVNLEGWRGRQLEVTVDHDFYATRGSDTYPVSIRRAVKHRMTPASVAAVALASTPHGRIDRIDLLPTEADVSRLVPHAASPNPQLPPGGPVWVVKLHGTFSGTHAPSAHTGSGYYVIDDKTGGVLEVGWP